MMKHDLPTRGHVLLLALLLTAFFPTAANGRDSIATSSLDMQQVTSPDTTRAAWYMSRADSLKGKASYDSARVYAEMAKVIYEEGKQWVQYVQAGNSAGARWTDMGRPDKALATLEPVLEKGRRYLGDKHEVVADTYNNMGVAYDALRDQDQALAMLRKALSIQLAMLSPDHRKVGWTYANMCNAYSNKAEYDLALESCHKARRILEIKPGLDLASVYLNLGAIYGEAMQPTSALEYLKQALRLDLAQLGPDHPYVADDYHNLGSASRDKGQLQQALEAHQKAFDIRLKSYREQPGFFAARNVAMSLDHTGIVLTDLGRYDEALDTLRQALTWFERYPSALESAPTYHHMANAYHLKGEPGKALEFYRKSLAILQATYKDKHLRLAQSYNNIAVVQGARGDLDSALVYLQRGLKNIVSTFDADDVYTNPEDTRAYSVVLLLRLLKSKGEVFVRRHEATGNPADLNAALAAYRLASAALDTLRLRLISETEKLELGAASRQIHDDALRVVMNLHHLTGDADLLRLAFQFAEKSKAAVLFETLTESHARRFSGIPASVVERGRALQDSLNTYALKFITHSMSEGNAASPQARALEDTLFRFRRAFEAHIDSLEQNHRRYFNLKYALNTASVDSLQQHVLSDTTILIEYFTGRDSLYLFTLTRTGFAVKTTPKDPTLEARIDSLRSAIKGWNVSFYADSLFLQPARALYRRLLAPIEDQTAGMKHFIIIPDGPLTRLPFEVLLTKDVQDQHPPFASLPYLIRDYAVSYAYSGTLLLHTLQERDERPRAERDFVGFAPATFEAMNADTTDLQTIIFKNTFSKSPTLDTSTELELLPHSHTEVEDVRSLFCGGLRFFECLLRGTARVYAEEAASEEQAKQTALDQYKIVHFATHAFAHPEEAPLSGLVLPGNRRSSGEDGILFLGEVYGLSLNAELVVLSACDTGLGQDVAGEGIIGLTRGFLYAGAARVLVSLWLVNDASTPQFMVNFYDTLLKTNSTAGALRQAKLKLIEAEAPPKFWAAFILIGT